ncbi:hypothetical protein [Azospirillum brasilense]|uniref:hypothetical protein n=1 Tax=Azospirillum brasilense TaxID=192 RepID=UPI000E0B031C|nr:hypothetical protein [Azospirillum brasilense]
MVIFAQKFSVFATALRMIGRQTMIGFADWLGSSLDAPAQRGPLNGKRASQPVRVGAGRAIGCLALALALSFTWRVGMASPVLAYMGIERIVVICRVDPADAGALTAAAMGEQARGIIAEGLPQARRPVAVVSAGDPAIIDPAALVVTIHANAAADPARPGLAAVAVSVHRPGQVSDAIPLFLAAPAAFEAGSGDAAMKRALRALLLPAVVEPLMSMPNAR